ERKLHAGSLGEIDLSDPVADVFDPHRAEEREVDEGIAVERAAGAQLRVHRARREAPRADGPTREEVLAAVLAARPEQLRWPGGIVRHGEVARLDGHADLPLLGPLLGHRSVRTTLRRIGLSNLRAPASPSVSSFSVTRLSRIGLIHAKRDA